MIDDDYMPVVNMVLVSFNLHDKFFAKHQLNYLNHFEHCNRVIEAGSGQAISGSASENDEFNARLQNMADDMRKPIANLTENARLFAETRKLLGSGGKVFEVVEDEQEQATEIAAEFYPVSVKGSPPTECGEAGSASPCCHSRAEPALSLPKGGNPPPPAESAEVDSVTGTTSGAIPPKPTVQSSLPGNGAAADGGNGSTKAPANKTALPPSHKNGNGSAAASGFNQLRNEFLTMARRVATTKKHVIGEVVEWASGGTFKYGDVGRMTEADVPKLRAATEFMSSAVGSTGR